MSVFARINRGLKDLFPSSTATIAMPRDLSEDVQLVQPFMGPLARWDTIRFRTNTSAAGVSLVGYEEVPENAIDWILYADVFHNDAALSHAFNFYNKRINDALAISVDGAFWLGGGTLVGANIPVPLSRPVLIPPGCQFVSDKVDVNAFGVGSTVTLQIAVVRLSFADLVHPS